MVIQNLNASSLTCTSVGHPLFASENYLMHDLVKQPIQCISLKIRPTNYLPDELQTFTLVQNRLGDNTPALLTKKKGDFLSYLRLEKNQKPSPFAANFANITDIQLKGVIRAISSYVYILFHELQLPTLNILNRAIPYVKSLEESLFRRKKRQPQNLRHTLHSREHECKGTQRNMFSLYKLQG